MIKKHLLLLLVIVISACEKEHRTDCFMNEGAESAEERNIGEFLKIKIEGNLDVILVQDTLYKIKIEGGSNLLPGVITEVRENTLHIKNGNKCNWVRSFKKRIKVYVNFKKINQVENIGPGKIESLNQITCDTLGFDIRSAGGEVNVDIKSLNFYFALHASSSNVKVRGTSDYNYFYCTGTGWIDGSNFINRHSFVNNSGTGTVTVNCHEILEASIHSFGNIRYYGTPAKVYTNITSTGKLIKL